MSAAVALLTKGMVRAMLLGKLKLLMAALLTLAVAGTGIGSVAFVASGQEAKPAPAARAARAAAKPQAQEKADKSAAVVEIIATRQLVLAFQPLTIDAFYVRQIPAALAEGWLTKAEVEKRINDGRRFKRWVGKDKPVSLDDFYDPRRDSIGQVLKAGEVAKTLGRAKPLSLSGLIVEGTHVDIELIASTPAKEGPKLLSTMIEDVEVLATNAVPADGTQPAKAADRVTLRVTREQAVLLAGFEGAVEKEEAVIRLIPRAPQVKRNGNEPVTDCLDEFAQALAQGKRTDEQCAEAIYLAALGRFPVTAEKEQVTNHLGQSTDRAKALRDVAWVLVNSTEFAAHLARMNAYEVQRK